MIYAGFCEQCGVDVPESERLAHQHPVRILATPIKAACPHMNFKAQVNVTRMTDNKDETTVMGYTAEITINCLECGLPFEFIGVDAGMMPTRPMASPDAQELRAPIRPKGCKIMPAIPGFTMRAE